MAAKSIVSDLMQTSLRIFGVWPNCSFRILKCFLLITALLTFLTFQYWYCISHAKTESLADLLDQLSIALSNMNDLGKFIVLCVNHRVITESLAIMAKDWNDLEQWDSEIMIRKAALCDRITKITLTLFFTTVPFYTATLFLVFENDTMEKRFLVAMELPFNSTVSPVYEIIVTVQVMGEWIFSVLEGVFLSFFATFVIHITARIEIITEKLKENIDSRKDEAARLASMGNIIVKHQRVIGLAEKTETIFTMIALVQFLYDIIVMCFIGFVLVASLDNGTFLTMLSRTLAYYLSINMGAFILCYSGEYLTVKAEQVTWVAYNCDWYDLTINESRMLLLIILRSQKPMTLTVGKLTTLSLVTFSNIMKTSASYVSILYAME